METPMRLVNKTGSINTSYRTLIWYNPFSIDSESIRGLAPTVWISSFAYFFFWIFFGAGYWCLEYFNGTLCLGPGPYTGCNTIETDPFYEKVTHESRHDYIDEQRCIVGVYDLQSALLFSVESLSTIGYGARSINPNCTVATFLLTIQSILAIVVPTIWTAMIIGKFKYQTSIFSVRFSQRAALTQEIGNKGKEGWKGKDGCFLNIKVAATDAIRGILLEASAIGIVIKRRNSCDEEIPDAGDDMQLIHFANDHGRQKTNFHVMWPTIISHEIDDNSPLKDFSEGKPGSDNFELVVLLKGSTSYDGGTVLQKTSYLPSEIVSLGAGHYSFEDVFKERVDFIAIREQINRFDVVHGEEQKNDVVDEM